MSTVNQTSPNYDDFKFSNNPVIDLQRKIRHGMVADIKAAKRKLSKLEKKKL